LFPFFGVVIDVVDSEVETVESDCCCVVDEIVEELPEICCQI